MRLFRLGGLFLIFCFGFCVSAQAQCPPWRPCGPGNSWGGNIIFPQGFYGADFRPACVAHDACYASCANRYDCDQAFLYNMYSACDYSSNPQACYRQARFYYVTARLFGGVLRE